MLAVDEVGVAIAAVYAKALLELAGENDMQEATLQELDELVSYANRDAAFEQFLSSAVVDVDARRGSLEKMLRGKVSDLVLDAVQVLNRKGRLPLLEAVCRQYRLAMEAQQNQLEVTVTSAVPLGDEARESLRQALTRHTGAEAILSEQVDPAILGGMVVRIGDEKVDFSVSTKLQGLRRTLLARASREIHGGRDYFDDV